MGFIYHQLGQYKTAMSIVEKVLVLRTEIFGEEHPDYLLALNNLAALHQKIQNNREAIHLFSKQVEIERRMPKQTGYDYSFSMINLALLYRLVGEYE